MTLHKIRTIMNRFRYGTATEEKDDFDNWVSRTPQEIYESGEGICYDALVLEDALMNEADIEHVNVFAVSERAVFDDGYEDDETHTFVVSYNKRWHYWEWIEGAWQKYKNNDIIGLTPFEVIDEVLDRLEKKNDTPYLFVIIKRIPRAGLTIGEFYEELLMRARKKHTDD